jgi:hypothetical protein
MLTSGLTVGLWSNPSTMAYTLVTSDKRAITQDQNAPVSNSLKSALRAQYCYFVIEKQVCFYKRELMIIHPL